MTARLDDRTWPISGLSLLLALMVLSATIAGGYRFATATSAATPDRFTADGVTTDGVSADGVTTADGSEWAAQACRHYDAEVVRREEGDLIDWEALEEADGFIDLETVDPSTIELTRPPVDGRMADPGRRPESVRFGPAPDPGTIDDVDLLLAVESCVLAGLLLDDESEEAESEEDEPEQDDPIEVDAEP